MARTPTLRLVPRGSRPSRRAKAETTAYHVVCAQDARHWRVLKGGRVLGDGRVVGDGKVTCLAVEPTRAQAVYRASVLAQADLPSQLLVHTQCGTIEALRDYA